MVWQPAEERSPQTPDPPKAHESTVQRNHYHLLLSLQGGDALDGGLGACECGDGGYGVIEGGPAIPVIMLSD